MRGPLQQHPVTLWENTLADGILVLGCVPSPVTCKTGFTMGLWRVEFYSVKFQCKTHPSALSRNLEWVSSGQGDFLPSSPVVFIKIDLFALLRTKGSLQKVSHVSQIPH